MKAKQLIDALRSQFTQELQAKTGWGRNEVLQAFERAAATTLGELVEVYSPLDQLGFADSGANRETLRCVIEENSSRFRSPTTASRVDLELRELAHYPSCSYWFGGRCNC